jgi:ribosomal protein L7Ae-like RNA K-turn-binding protein
MLAIGRDSKSASAQLCQYDTAIPKSEKNNEKNSLNPDSDNPERRALKEGMKAATEAIQTKKSKTALLTVEARR